MSTDRIEKQILLRAPRGRVWLALTDSQKFGRWFGIKADGPFVEGKEVHATIVPTEVDEKVAAAQKEFEGMPFVITVERIEPEKLFSFRWHPHAVDKNVDYSKEATTLVSFTLDEEAGGVRLTVTETGFDRIPLERRAKAFAANEGGWGMVVQLVAKFLERENGGA
jgi:uncharacterized protein YndB with AHSA1/START domain